ncbi:hypothetical protein Sjap_004439 [Stephania japonica]|uniref:Uncharacterized protein n=1 Tax=Stephania japonica TaxID=461633 RepID=A0AAP0PKX2_9MAGN
MIQEILKIIKPRQDQKKIKPNPTIESSILSANQNTNNPQNNTTKPRRAFTDVIATPFKNIKSRDWHQDDLQ